MFKTKSKQTKQQNTDLNHTGQLIYVDSAISSVYFLTTREIFAQFKKKKKQIPAF